MRPSFLEDMSWAMGEVYAEIVDRILINLAKYFPYMALGEEPRGSFEYQARMLAQMGKVNRETLEIIRRSLQGADEALRDSLEAAILDALKNEEPQLRKAAEKGILMGEGFLPPEVDPSQMQAFQYYYRQSADKLNLVNTVMLESTQQAYQATVSDIVAQVNRTQSILNAGAGEVVTGVSSWNEATRHAVDKMVENGLTGFVDHGGHHWRPETYAAMDIKTTMFNTAREAVFERNEQYGNDLYQVSSHNGARPLCYPWQGKIISRADRSGTTEDLDGNKIPIYPQSSTSYGQAAGLFGVNCKHYPMVFIPGVSTLKGHPQDPEENEKAYEESQKQRALERNLREKRLKVEQLKAQGAPEEEIRTAKEKARAASDRVQEFCDETGRARRRNREGTPVRTSWTGAKTPPFEIPVANVINEYRASSTPGVGQIIREGPNKEHEILTAENLVKQIGGNVTLIDNSGRDPIRDCIWHNKEWEIKRAGSPKAASKRTEIGCKQIAETGGNLIIDCCCEDFDIALRNIMTKLKAVAPAPLDIVILHNGKVKKIFRYSQIQK